MIENRYLKAMSEKSARYEALIAKAERERRDQGKPSKQEAIYYRDAARVCEEIRDMNLSQRSEHSKWDMRAADCMSLVEEIIHEIDASYRTSRQIAAEQLANQAAACASSAAHVPAAQNPPQSASAQTGNTPSRPAAAPGTTVRTASGFETANACMDVSAETIERWFEPQPNHDFSDVTGMEDTKKKLMNLISSTGWKKTNELMDYRQQKCIFFYGLPGTGKTFVIQAFISELMKKGYQYIHLEGGDIHASHVGVAEKTVMIAFQEAIDKSPCVLFIDEFENVCVNRNKPNTASHERRLTDAFLEAYNHLKESNADVIVVGATNYPNLVDNAMMDRLYPVLVPLPDAEEREQYFFHRFRNIRTDDSSTIHQLAEKTEDCSYRDMEKITVFIQDQLREKAVNEYGVFTDGILDVAKSDEPVSEALRTGNVYLTQAMIDEVLADFSPSDKSENRRYLEEFENKQATADN